MAGQLSPSKWLFLRELKCYAIGYYKDGNWRCYIPMCYASKDALKVAGKLLDESPAIALECFIPADEYDYLLVVPGNPVTFEIEHPQSPGFDWIYGTNEGLFVDGTSGKITINGQVVYGSTPFGMVWTPVRPDMGAIDLYGTTSGLGMRRDVSKNLFGHSEDKE